MKSMLQQLDTNLFSIDGLIQEQSGKLAEKEKVISNNQAEIERLEKRTKMQEHKVKRQGRLRDGKTPQGGGGGGKPPEMNLVRCPEWLLYFSDWFLLMHPIRRHHFHRSLTPKHHVH